MHTLQVIKLTSLPQPAVSSDSKRARRSTRSNFTHPYTVWACTDLGPLVTGCSTRMTTALYTGFKGLHTMTPNYSHLQVSPCAIVQTSHTYIKKLSRLGVLLFKLLHGYLQAQHRVSPSSTAFKVRKQRDKPIAPPQRMCFKKGENIDHESWIQDTSDEYVFFCTPRGIYNQSV